MADKDLGQDYQFEQVDADAVCEQCSTVHAEPTLICKTCGNNLRDQRTRRISGDQPMPVGVGDGISRFRLFTTILSGLGILIILLVVISIDDIEQWLVGIQVEEETGFVGDVWSGPGSEIYETLEIDLDTNPVTRAEERDALENPVIDDSFHGRYVLSGSTGLQGNAVVGYANLNRRGDTVYFVAKLDRGLRIRGFAELRTNEAGEVSPVAINSASALLGGADYLAWGYAQRNEDGSHTVFGQSAFDDRTHGVLAHRVR